MQSWVDFFQQDEQLIFGDLTILIHIDGFQDGLYLLRWKFSFELQLSFEILLKVIEFFDFNVAIMIFVIFFEQINNGWPELIVCGHVYIISYIRNNEYSYIK